MMVKNLARPVSLWQEWPGCARVFKKHGNVAELVNAKEVAEFNRVKPMSKGVPRKSEPGELI